MLNLVRKDFIAGAVFLLGVAIIIPFLSTIAMAAMIDDFGGINLGIFTLIIIGSCIGASFIFITIDTSYKTETTYASLPLKRSTIVGARYVSSIIITVAGFFLVVLSSISAVHLFKLTDPAFSVILDARGLTSMISFLLVILAFMFPFTFKFGPGKGAIAALIVQIGVVLLVPLFGFIKNALSDVWNFDILFFYKLLLEFLTWIAALPSIYAYLFTFSIVFMFTMASIVLSVRCYNRRDL